MATLLKEARGSVVLAARSERPRPEIVREFAGRIIRPALLEAAIREAGEEAVSD
jgi:hypothetical protein